MTTFIHYGSDRYDPDLFIPIRNCDWKPKPDDGTGLWATREADIYPEGGVIYGWKEWCEDSNYKLESLKKSFRFRLKDTANILLLSAPTDLLPLPKTKPWNLKDYDAILKHPEGQVPTLEQVEAYCKPNPCFLDYEKLLADGVDAIELKNSIRFSRCLDTWDCDCLLVMNPDVIEDL